VQEKHIYHIQLKYLIGEENNPFFGKHHSEETKQKISLAKKEKQNA